MNKERGLVPIELGGETLYLKYDVNAFCAFEDATGFPIGALMERDEKAWGLRDIRALLWAGLLHGEHSPSPKSRRVKALTMTQVGAMMDFEDLETYIQPITDALEAAMPDKPTKEEEAAAKGEEKPARSPGTKESSE